MALSGWEIRTERLLIRDFVESDCTPEFLNSLNDKGHLRHSLQRLETHNAETQAVYIASFVGSHDHYLALLACEGTPRVVGSITVRYSKDLETCDLGILVIRPFAAMGFGQEAWSATVLHLEVQSQVSGLTAGTSCRNIAMQRILRASSFAALNMCDRDDETSDHECTLVFARPFRGGSLG